MADDTKDHTQIEIKAAPAPIPFPSDFTEELRTPNHSAREQYNMQDC
jgi:hypothetical protein